MKIVTTSTPTTISIEDVIKNDSLWIGLKVIDKDSLYYGRKYLCRYIDGEYRFDNNSNTNWWGKDFVLENLLRYVLKPDPGAKKSNSQVVAFESLTEFIEWYTEN